MPKVKPETVNSIIDEILTKNPTVGLEEFECENMLTYNKGMAVSIFSLLESIADFFSTDPKVNEEMCCIAKIAAHVTYKSIEKQIDINSMEDL